MSPSQREKAQGHAEHLLDLFIGLRGTYAMLEPLLFDRDVVARWGSGKRAHGFNLLTLNLLHSCVLGIAKIALDNDARTPSVWKLVSSLDHRALVEELREEYALWHLAPTSGEEPEVIDLVQRAERREEAERRVQFNGLVAETRLKWLELQESKALASFVTMRDKLIAHSELLHDGTKYRAVDVRSLGLKFGDLRSVIDALQTLVDRLTLIYRRASFAFDGLDKQLKGARDHFWQPA
jgi:hypothetical protein